MKRGKDREKERDKEREEGEVKKVKKLYSNFYLEKARFPRNLHIQNSVFY